MTCVLTDKSLKLPERTGRFSHHIRVFDLDAIAKVELEGKPGCCKKQELFIEVKESMRSTDEADNKKITDEAKDKKIRIRLKRSDSPEKVVRNIMERVHKRKEKVVRNIMERVHKR